MLRIGDPWQVPATFVARDPSTPYPLGATEVASQYRIDAAPPTNRGFFDAVIGNLLGIFLG